MSYLCTIRALMPSFLRNTGKCHTIEHDISQGTLYRKKKKIYTHLLYNNI